ncbi:MAG: pyruvate ferredoxin oxidoreductase [Candidatus Bathyarchaeia archaeon]
MAKTIGLSGDQAAAYAAKQCDVDVVAAYPITPQTIIVEEYSNYVADGEVDTEFICVESEHSAMSACIGASLTGARVFTATASQGLALMHEMLYIASGLRCPIVMCVANRALSAPLNIHCDHSDMMGSRDCGWIQVFVENAQEVYDWVIQSFRIAEDEDVLLPVAVNLDGFTLSHALEDFIALEDAEVRDFVGVRKPKHWLAPGKAITVGAAVLPDYYMEIKHQQEDALQRSITKIGKVNELFEKVSGRRYKAVDTYGLDDAEAAVVCLGSTAGTAKVVSDALREKGYNVGVVKPWVYRPFPVEEFLDSVKNVKSLAVLERTISFGAPNEPLFNDVLSTLYKAGRQLKIFNAVYGLGGRDISPHEMETLMMEAYRNVEVEEIDKRVRFIGVRG